MRHRLFTFAPARRSSLQWGEESEIDIHGLERFFIRTARNVMEKRAQRRR